MRDAATSIVKRFPRLFCEEVEDEQAPEVRVPDEFRFQQL